MDRPERIAALRKALSQRVIILDGAMGTLLQGMGLQAEDFGGTELEGCNENLVLEKPEMIRQIHLDYFLAGADVSETNTFGGTPLVLAEYGLEGKTEVINQTAARLAREAADEAQTKLSRSEPFWVAGAIGPTTKAITVTGGVGFDELVEHFRAQARGLHLGGVDFFLLETSQDTRNVKAALFALQEVNKELGFELPIAVSGTIEPMGTMLAGQSVEALYTALEHVDLLYLGLNCATGPEFMTDHIRSLSELCRFPTGCVPNAGLPDEDGNYLETPQMLTRVLQRFVEEGWLNVVGGCCGTTPEHVKVLAQAVRNLPPRKLPDSRRSTLSGVDYLEIKDDERPVLVGERTNVIGSRRFKTLIVEGRLDEACEIGVAQVKSGAHVIDVCLANPDRDELEDTRAFLEKFVRRIRAPLMIDSTDEKVIELALSYSQGKAIINSINLEDGEERFEKVVPLARKFGAALVVGCIDDHPQQGMAISKERKLEVAARSFELLTRKYGVAPEDIYFDPLVFPCATGDEQYLGSAVETIEGVRLLKEHFPSSRTVLGISNVSFGLPASGREVLNSVFLYHCVQAGLDLALVNTEKLQRYPSIPEEERKLADDLLWNRGADPIAAFAAHFRNRPQSTVVSEDLPLDERLARYIIEGRREGLIEDLEEKRANTPPLEIINGPLMAGMDEVGRLFNSNELIVAEVLQSAEVMKTAVAHLEPFMEKADTASRGTVILATVKGDVHDIGKNLVDIILSNNGFSVKNLGIRVPPEQLLEAVREHRPDIIGLSGLLVKSAQQMALTAGDLQRAGVKTPMLVGGAALSRGFVHRQIVPAYQGTVAYAQDAMSGLELAKKIVNPESHEELKNALEEERKTLLEQSEKEGRKVAGQGRKRRSEVIEKLRDLPQPPDFQRHVLTTTPLDQVWNHINPMMLYGRHLGLRGSIVRTIESADVARLAATEQGRKALALREAVETLKAQCRQGAMKVKAVYRFFRAESEGDVLTLRYPDGSEAARFEFGRQPGENGLCLSDYVAEKGSGLVDTVGLFVVTAGEGIRALADELKDRGEYLKCHAIQSLALESAEGYAELIHARMRSMWGFPDDPKMTMLDRFRANYRGKRYSFGYPACPRLEDQEALFSALQPEDIGVQLTDGCMMEPEASVSAIVFHHPQATYFSVSDDFDPSGMPR